LPIKIKPKFLEIVKLETPEFMKAITLNQSGKEIGKEEPVCLHSTNFKSKLMSRMVVQ